MAASYIKKDKEKIIYNGDGELIYYIPEKYFEANAAYPIGSIIECLGIFQYQVLDKSGKVKKTGNFDACTLFQCIPNYITKEKEYSLSNTEPRDYRLLHFKKGDVLIVNVNVPAKTTTIETFMNLLTRGHLPNTIPYNDLYRYVLNNADANDFGFSVSNQVVGFLTSELCRDPKDLSRPFRWTDMKDMTGYKFTSIKNIPKYTSPYTAITSENADESIASAITTNGTTESPLEKVMMN